MELLDIERDTRDAAVVEAQTHPARMLVIDLDDVTHFGSAGLNALLGCSQRGDAGGVGVRLVATNPEVVRPIEVTRLDAVPPLCRTVDEALAPNGDRR